MSLKRIGTKLTLWICVILLTVSGLVNIALYQNTTKFKNRQDTKMWQEHLERIHFFSYTLEQIIPDLQASPVPIEHIDSKLRLAIAGKSKRAYTGLIEEQADETDELDWEKYDSDWIIWMINEELLGLVNSENQLTEREYEKLAIELALFNGSLEEYWLGVGSDNKGDSVRESRVILLEILDEIKKVRDSLSAA